MPVALRYWCPVALPLWLLSFLLPGTKSATQLLPGVLLSLICMLDFCLSATFHSWYQQPNVSPRCYKAYCPVLLVSCIPATVAAFIPRTRNEMGHTLILLCDALFYMSP